MIPIGDFLGQALLYSGFCLRNKFEFAITYFCQMFRYHMSDGIALSFLLKLTVNPLGLRSIENGIDTGFICR